MLVFLERWSPIAKWLGALGTVFGFYFTILQINNLAKEQENRARNELTEKQKFTMQIFMSIHQDILSVRENVDIPYNEADIIERQISRSALHHHRYIARYVNIRQNFYALDKMVRLIDILGTCVQGGSCDERLAIVLIGRDARILERYYGPVITSHAERLVRLSDIPNVYGKGLRVLSTLETPASVRSAPVSQVSRVAPPVILRGELAN